MNEVIEVIESNEVTKAISDILSSNVNHHYMMLDRLKSDCEYFLGYGGRSIKHLYFENVANHIAVMKGIHNSLDIKPEWLTMDEILVIEQKMTEGA